MLVHMVKIKVIEKGNKTIETIMKDARLSAVLHTSDCLMFSAFAAENQDDSKN